MQSPTLRHDVIQRDLEIPRTITWIHYISAVMLIGPGKEDVAGTLETLVRNVCSGGRAVNPVRVRDLPFQ